MLHRNQAQERLWFAKLLFKITKETINVLTATLIHYFSQWTFFRSSCSEVFCERIVLKFSQNLQQKTCACDLQLYLKRDCYRCLNFVKLLRTPFLTSFFNTSGGCFWCFLLSWSFLHFILKWQDCKIFTKLVPSDFFLGLTKLNPKAVTWMCSIKKLFLEILENSQKNICTRVSF